MLIFLNRQLSAFIFLAAVFGSGPLAFAKNSDKTRQHWKSVQLERAKEIFAQEEPSLSMENISDDVILSNYRTFVLKKLGKISSEELGTDGNKGYGHLNLPAFKDMFVSSSFECQGECTPADESWQVAWGAAERYWRNFNSWYQKGSYHTDLNQLLKKVKRDQKRLISKKKWLERMDVPISSYLQNYSKRQLETLKKQKTIDFLQIHLVKDLGRVDLNNDSEALNALITRIQRWVGGISLFLSDVGVEPDDEDQVELFNLSFQAEKPYYFQLEKNIDEFTWIEEKIKYASDVIPEPILLDGGLYKVVRIMFAHVLFALNNLDESLNETQIDKIIFRALQSGYYYGLTYPLIDDLSDSNRYLDDSLRETMEDFILKGLSGAPLDLASIPEHPIPQAILHIFKDLQELYPHKDNRLLWDSLYVLFKAQIVDRKNLHASYEDEDVYIPILLKSVFTRIVTAAFTRNISDGFIENAFATALINQLNDDLRDQEHDKKHGQFTPFTWSPSEVDGQHKNDPFHLYLASLTYLNHIHGKDSGASEACMQRLSLALGRLYGKMGDKEFKSHLSKFELKDPNTIRYLTKLARRRIRQEDPEKVGHEKLKLLGVKLKERKAIKAFQAYMMKNRAFIEEILPIKSETGLSAELRLTDAMNYSVQAGGKRIRPLLALMTGEFYGIERERLVPFFRSLEFLHTSSLILDDLPAQDNADLRRGEPTLHKAFDEATAHLSSVKLLAKAIGQISQLDSFDDDIVNELTGYASTTIEEMCVGQMMDLQGQKHAINSVEQLKILSHYKTGLAIEAAIWPVARLAEASHEEQDSWKSFARNLGLLFQIRDDILDVEGDQKLLGKVVGTDEANNASTFVSLLGLPGAYSLLSETWLAAKQDLRNLEEAGRNTETFQGVLDFIFLRDH